MNSLRFHRAWVYLTAAWSGFFVMGVEILGGRLLSPYFGSSIFVWGGIIAVFMMSLSLGYLWGGRLSRHQPSLPKLQALVAAAAVMALPIVLMGGAILEWLSYLIPDPRYGSLVGSGLLFGAATFLSGTISPYAVRLLINGVSDSGQVAGMLYFVSTLGSALGTIMTSFYLVLYADIDHIVMGFIATSFIIAGVGVWQGWNYTNEQGSGKKGA